MVWAAPAPECAVPGRFPPLRHQKEAMVGIIRAHFMFMQRVKALRRRQPSEHFSTVVLCCQEL